MSDSTLDLTPTERHLVTQLRHLGKDAALRHLPSVIVEQLAILVDRDIQHNGEHGVMQNCFTAGDATAYVNFDQCVQRIAGKVKCGDRYLRMCIPSGKIEGRELIQDLGNWVWIWACCRVERRAIGLEKDCSQSLITRELVRAGKWVRKMFSEK